MPRFTGIDRLIAASGSITTALRELGVASFRKRESRISARLPSRSDARLLAQPISRPILFIESVTVDASGAPIEVAHSRLAGRWLELVIRHDA